MNWLYIAVNEFVESHVQPYFTIQAISFWDLHTECAKASVTVRDEFDNEWVIPIYHHEGATLALIGRPEEGINLPMLRLDHEGLFAWLWHCAAKEINNRR